MKRNEDDQRTWLLIAVVAGALLVRTLYLLSIRHAPFSDHLVTEPARYDAWARDIVRGAAPVRPPFDEAPAYPYFVALVYTVAGHNVFAVTALQALMDAASCALVAAMGLRLSGMRVATIAGVLAALYGPMIYFTGQLEPATLTVFVTSLALFFTPTQPATRKQWLACGAIWALTLLVRSEMLLALPVVIAHAWIVGKRPSALRVAAAPTALLAVTLAINLASSGHAVLLTTGSGVNLWIGNNEQADGVSPFVEGPMLATAHEIEGKTSDAVVADTLFRERALDFVKREPGRELALLAKKALWLFSDRELPNATDIAWQEKQSFVFAVPLVPLRFGMIFPLALAGLVALRTRFREIIAWFAPVAVAFVVAVAFFTCARFRMPMSPVLVLFAAFAFETKRDLTLKACALALGLLLAFGDYGRVRAYRIKAIDEETHALYTSRAR